MKKEKGERTNRIDHVYGRNCITIGSTLNVKPAVFRVLHLTVSLPSSEPRRYTGRNIYLEEV